MPFSKILDAPADVKVYARFKVQQAIVAGRLIPGPCEICCKAKTEAHHEDYRNPPAVRWLCRACHRQVEAITRRQAAPAVEVEQIRLNYGLAKTKRLRERMKHALFPAPVPEDLSGFGVAVVAYDPAIHEKPLPQPARSPAKPPPRPASPAVASKYFSAEEVARLWAGQRIGTRRNRLKPQ